MVIRLVRTLVLDLAFVPEFLVATSLLEPAEVCRTELKPFLTIFGTNMRAISVLRGYHDADSVLRRKYNKSDTN
jgi:hypothetical protein